MAINNEEIDNLEAGRELDALVAEKVMGWDRSEWSTADDILLPPEGSTGRRENRLYRVPNYSTDIAAVWEVVDKIFNEFGLPLSLTNIRDLEWHWAARFRKPESNYAVAKTAPLAICRAALKAMSGG